MSEPNEHIEQLDNYLNGAMSDTQRNAFEEQLRNNPALRESLDEHKSMVANIRKASHHKSLKLSFDALHESTVLVEEKTVQLPHAANGKWRLLAVAASVAILAVAGSWVVFQSIYRSETARYMELKGTVDQLSKSIAQSNQKREPIPARFTGTGFLLSSSGYIATSYHLIKGADSVFVQNEKFGRLKTTVLKTDQVNDVAILKIEDDDFKASAVPYQITSKQADLGEVVYTLGFPREEIVYGEGTISAATGYKQNVTAYQIAVPVNPGNSGGPLFNQQGNVVGMISGIETHTQGAAFAVKSGILLDVINNMASDSLANTVPLPKASKLKSLSRVQQVKKIREYVFVVNVYDHQ